ncbi:MAG: hypothetical protein IKK11_03940 [Oscillospiraceae bacterium]|nr:hypothetical protein [Oscillospiraceae bacterium]
MTTLFLWLSLNKSSKDFSTLLTLTVCAMVITVSASFLEPVISFLKQLQNISSLNQELFVVILKSVGICIIAEICTLVCKDAGNESMGKALQLISASVILWLSVPVFEKLLSLLDKMLGSL